MKRITTISILLVALAVQLMLGGCVRRPLEDGLPTTALIPVKIDWSDSNIPVTESEPSGGEWVHRVSLRFYPEDGSEIFECYLEGNIFEGTIEVPAGRYDVIVMNESVLDTNYWEGTVTFSDADSFDDFSASVNTLSDASGFPYYTPAAGEKLVVEPARLASWSLKDFEVTDEMVAVSRAAAPETTDALTNVKMRRLTYNVTVVAHFGNLASAQAIHTASTGFADKVYIASAERVQSPATHPFLMKSRTLSEGTAQHMFLSFGRVPVEDDGTYMIDMTVLLTSGELYAPPAPLIFDVTDQVTSAPGPDIRIEVPARMPGDTGPIELPVVKDGIFIGDWDEEVIPIS